MTQQRLTFEGRHNEVDLVARGLQEIIVGYHKSRMELVANNNGKEGIEEKLAELDSLISFAEKLELRIKIEDI